MDHTYQSIVIAILTIAGYPNNKERYAARFEETNYEEALVNTIEKLPFATQELIRACNNDPEQIKHYIPTDLLTREVIEVSAIALNQLLEALAPMLSVDQKARIAELLFAEEGSPSLPLQA